MHNYIKGTLFFDVKNKKVVLVVFLLFLLFEKSVEVLAAEDEVVASLLYPFNNWSSKYFYNVTCKVG